MPLKGERKWDNPTFSMVEGARRNLPEYQCWSNMRNRCKPRKCYPTYAGCTYHSDWDSYDVWLEWAKKQVGFLNRDENGILWNLDKDILFKGNKHYSPETCVFVPKRLNCLLNTHKRVRGSCPIGVYYKTSVGNYLSQVNYGIGSQVYLGVFETMEAAILVYKNAKEKYVKQLALEYVDIVDSRVVTALRNFTVDIND